MAHIDDILSAIDEPRTTNEGTTNETTNDTRYSIMMRRTKIIATVGPASDSDAVLDALIAAGTDIVRLNFSHGTHDTQAATYARIRAAAKRANREVAVLQDLGGPKIRTGLLQDGRPITLTRGDTLRIATGDFAGG